jgi:hypothetical protein
LTAIPNKQGSRNAALSSGPGYNPVTGSAGWLNLTGIKNENGYKSSAGDQAPGAGVDHRHHPRYG